MEIHVNTDTNVDVNEERTEQIDAEVTDVLARFEGRLTRVDVHLSNDSAGRSTGEDVRCLIEACPAGLAPIVVTHHAATLAEALSGAMERTEARLTSLFERREGHQSRTTIRGH